LLDGTSSIADAPDNRAGRRDSSTAQCTAKLIALIGAIPPGIFVRELLFMWIESSAELP